MELLSRPDAWIALLTLVFLEIILGIDNIIFISITTAKLPAETQKKATRIGLILAMVMRIILLFGVSYLIAMKHSFWDVESSFFSFHLTGQSIILILGGIFLLYKSTSEIHHKVEKSQESDTSTAIAKSSFASVIFQIVMIDIVFSFDSVLTAVGMTNGIEGALIIMVTAVILSVIVMMAFATPVSNFVNRHPSIQILALSFLILIGFMLVTEGAHLAHAVVLDQPIGAIPKGYLYFAISFSLGIEALNFKIRKK